jgi:hypothetical protein
VGAILHGDFALFEQLPEHLVDQGSAFQRMVHALVAHQRLGQTAKLIVNQRKQLVDRARFAARPVVQ